MFFFIFLRKEKRLPPEYTYQKQAKNFQKDLDVQLNN